MGRGKRRVWIHYEPHLYEELFVSVIRSYGIVEIVDDFFVDPSSGIDGEGGPNKVDMIVLSLDDNCQPTWSALPVPLSNTRVVAFCPKGDYGLKYLPDECRWIEVRPFGLAQLIDEVNGN